MPKTVHSPLFSGATGPATILVMDDDASCRDAALAMLGWLGCTATGTPDGDAAAATYHEALEAGRRFDAVLLDLAVDGGLGGAGALERLRGEDPSVRAILVLQGGFEADVVERFRREYGFASVVRKPIDVVGLVRAMLEAGVPRGGANAAA